MNSMLPPYCRCMIQALLCQAMHHQCNRSPACTSTWPALPCTGDADGDREGQPFMASHASSSADQTHGAGVTAQPQQPPQEQQQLGPAASAPTPSEGSSSTVVSSRNAAATTTSAAADAGADPSAHNRSPHSPSTSNRQGAESVALMSAVMLTATPTATPRKARAQGPALCVFSGGTAFNVVAGACGSWGKEGRGDSSCAVLCLSIPLPLPAAAPSPFLCHHHSFSSFSVPPPKAAETFHGPCGASPAVHHCPCTYSHSCCTATTLS